MPAQQKLPSTKASENPGIYAKGYRRAAQGYREKEEE
jgi:hypothetical protein